MFQFKVEVNYVAETDEKAQELYTLMLEAFCNQQQCKMMSAKIEFVPPQG